MEEATENQPLQQLKSLQGYRYHYTDMTMNWYAVHHWLKYVYLSLTVVCCLLDNRK